MRRGSRYLCLLVALMLPAGRATAQEGPITFEFVFSNPGARSIALGGAFAALADDATAAFANPAGITQLLEPEVSIEARLWAYETPYVTGGRAEGTATGIGIDTVDGLQLGTSSHDLNGISFLSLVYPAHRWSIAAYAHQLAKFELDTMVNGLFGAVEGEPERSEDVHSTTTLEVLNYGLVGAYELTDSLSFGLGIVYFEAEVDASSREYTYDEDSGFFAANPFLPELLDTTYSYRGKDTGLAIHGGFLWRPTPQWSFGGYYREGPEMTIHVSEVTGPGNDDEVPTGTVEVDATTPLQLPDVIGLGVAYRSRNGALTVGLEWDRVRYSKITESFSGVFDRNQITLDDGNELRLGIEYVIASTRPLVALRAGVWHDPAHGIGPGPAADLFEATIFHGGKDQTHLTGGFGLVFKRWQLDLGFDRANTVDQASLSMVYRF